MTPIILHIPHASTVIPADCRADFIIDDATLAQHLAASTDHFTDELFDARAVNASSVTFPISRLALDPERFERDEDESMAALGLGVLYERGHNNLGEFLAIIDACQRLERGDLKCATLWSDSKTALSWFRTGKIRTTIDVDGQCDSAFAAAVNDARKWLESANRPKWFAMMSRWDTSARGENPADFGRK